MPPRIRIRIRIPTSNPLYITQSLKSSDLIISSLNNRRLCIEYLSKLTIFYKKNVIGGQIKQLEGVGGIYVPFTTESKSNLLQSNEQEFELDQIDFFPYLPQHNVVWAKLLFRKLFIDLPIQLNNQSAHLLDQLQVKIVY